MLDFFQAMIPVVALLTNVAAQLLAAQLKPWRRYLRSVLVGYGAGLASLLVLEGFVAWSYPDGPREELGAITLVNLVTYSALAYCFFAGFINPGITSLRVRLFRELQHSKDGLSMDQVLALYDPRRVIELRLDRLVSGKQIAKREGRYYLERSSLWALGALIGWAKKVVMGKASEFS
jgi:hypothetical protein